MRGYRGSAKRMRTLEVIKGYGLVLARERMARRKKRKKV